MTINVIIKLEFVLVTYLAYKLTRYCI